MKFFITGGSGLLGERLATVVDPDDELILSHNLNKTPDSVKCDITNHEETRKTIMKYDPDVIIHTAAMTNVDLCEDKIDQTYSINADATGNLAKIADDLNIKIIYVSTDFVFDGKQGNYKEDDNTNPLGIYAKSKYQGEVQLKQNTDNYAIGRVSVLYGWHNRANFTTWVIDELRKGNEINIVTDQINSPTYADNAAEALFKLAKTDKTGIYHTAGNDLISRYDFTLKIAEEFDLNCDLINPITSDKFIQKAPRPRDSSLNVKKIEDDLGFCMETCSESLKRMADDEV